MLILSKSQQEAKEFLITNRRCLLRCGQGFGKTITTLSALSELISSNKIKRALIVSTGNILKDVWIREINAFSEFDNLKGDVLDCTTASIKDTVTKLVDTNCFFLTVDKLATLCHDKNDFLYTIDALIIDESTLYKSYSSERFKRLKKFIDKEHSFEYIALLTGTFVTKDYIDIWSQIYLLDFGKSLGKNITEFKTTFFIEDKYTFKLTLIVPESELFSKIKHLIYSSDDKIHNKLLPSLNRTVVKIKPSVATLEYFKDIIKYRRLVFNNITFTAETALLFNMRLLHLCNGSLYYIDEDAYEEFKKDLYDGFDPAYHEELLYRRDTLKYKATMHLHHDKAIALKRLLENESNINHIVIYYYKSDIEILEKYIDNIVFYKNHKDSTSWNEGKIKVLALHSKKHSKGLNLQFGGNSMIWYSLPYNYDDYAQMNKRLHRKGQEQDVTIRHLVLDYAQFFKAQKIKNVEENVLLNLNNKSIKQQSIVDYLTNNRCVSI